MIMIAHVEEARQLQHIPREVAIVVEGIAEVLDSEYAVDMDVREGDGGYILIIETFNELDELKYIYIDIDEVIPEFTDAIKVEEGEDYTSTLILLNNYFGISLIMLISLAPKRFQEE
jgi:hypothetical protein